MNKLNVLVFDGKPLTTDGVYIFPDNENWNSPDKETTTVSVPGRDGDLVMTGHRYKNRTLGYQFILYRDKHKKYYDYYKNLLLGSEGYKRLEDSTDDGVFLRARCTKVSPLKVHNDASTFSVEFDAMPQRWLKIGEKKLIFRQSGQIFSTHYCEALPLVRVYGHGILTVGEHSITIAENQNSFIDIDCDIKDAYCGAVNCNSLITLQEWPSLIKGKNIVSFPSTISRVEITPRWWTL